MNARRTTYRQVVLGALVVGLALAQPAAGQFTLDAFAPADGETGVSTRATVTFTFSAALDTDASFTSDTPAFDGFYLNLTIYPAPESLFEVRLSGDERTVDVDLQLADDTKYQVMLEGAFSATGQLLARPHEFTFTTGDALPTGTVSGTVTFDGGDPTGALVGVFRAVAGQPLFEDDAEGAAVVMDASGSYTANYVSAGEYVVAAFKDQNGDGVADDPYEDALRAYDGDGDRLIDVVTVGDGENVEDIDVAIQVPVRSTARGPFPIALLLARLAATDARLGVTLAEVTPEGDAPAWAYGFYVPSTGDTLGILAIGDQFAFGPGFLEDEENGGDEGFPFDLTRPLPDDWIDSDVAVDSAEARGGARYRATNPDAIIVSFLGNLPEELCALISTTGRVGEDFTGVRSPEALYARLRRQAAKASAQPQPYWLVFYLSPSVLLSPFAVCVDAVTGEAPPPRALTSARTNLNIADEAARSWAADARLVALGVASEEGLDATGTTLNWGFAYYSPSMDQARNVFVSDSLVLTQEDLDPADLPSLDPLPENWIDSSTAAGVAEANSAGFRNQHADAVVSALLSRGQLQNEPDRAVWRFVYLSLQDNILLVIDIDAQTGAVIGTAVEAEPGVPEAFVLDQNYPNPFNPETRIPFGLARAGHVRLTVYNVLGQAVATLVDQFLPAGNYTFAWRPGALPSGLYVYRLESAETVRSRTMILQK